MPQMTDLTNQKRIAASLLKCGVHRVWFDPEKNTDIQNAISREDIRGLIGEGAIEAEQIRGVSRGRARAKIAKRSYGHCKGSRKEERCSWCEESLQSTAGSRKSVQSENH